MFEIKTENINQISVMGDNCETTIKLYNCVGTPLNIVLQTGTAEALSENLKAYFDGKKAKEEPLDERREYAKYLRWLKTMGISSLALQFDEFMSAEKMMKKIRGQEAKR